VPYEDGIVEDRVSRRGLIASYRRLAKEAFPEELDVKEISERALTGRDRAALQAFAEFGSTLGEVMRPICTKFGAACLVLGGQISKSFLLFAGPLQEQLKSVACLQKIAPAELGDWSALYGAAKPLVAPGA